MHNHLNKPNKGKTMDIHEQNSKSFTKANKFMSKTRCARHFEKGDIGETLCMYEDGFALASDGAKIYEAETPAEVRIFIAYFTDRARRVANLACLARCAFKPATVKFKGAAEFEMK